MIKYYVILLLMTIVWSPVSAKTLSIKQKLYALQKGESLGYHHILGTENTYGPYMSSKSPMYSFTYTDNGEGFSFVAGRKGWHPIINGKEYIEWFSIKTNTIYWNQKEIT